MLCKGMTTQFIVQLVITYLNSLKSKCYINVKIFSNTLDN